MELLLITAPTLEPVTLAELKTHLRIDSGTFAGDTSETQSIYPGSHAITVGYTLIGEWADVGGYTAIVNLLAGTNGATGTVDVKIQESDNQTVINDWTGGGFTQVTEANDNTSYEKTYTGTKRYIRAVGKVLLAACEFGVLVQAWSATTSEDALLNELISGGRLSVENDTSKKIMSQTWEYYPKCWPSNDRIKIPFGNLTSVTFVKWKDTDGTSTTLTENTDYLVETNGEQCGFVVLPYGGAWPSGTLYPSNPITVKFVCGYATQAAVPVVFKQAVKRWCTVNYADLGDGRAQNVIDGKTYERMINLCGRLNDMDFL